MVLRRFGLVASTAFLIVALAACGSDDGGSAPEAKAPADFPAGSKMAEIAKAGTLNVGIFSTYPLIGYRTFDGYEGFDVEIAQALAERLGVPADKVKFTPLTTPTREPFLRQGKVDFVTAAYTITDERDDVIDFAGPYVESQSGVMTKGGNPEGIQSMEDIGDKNLKLCVVGGGDGEPYIRKNYPKVAANMVLFDASAKCRDAVLNGQVDASTTDLPILASFVAESEGKLDVVDGIAFNYAYWGIGVQQTEDKAFCEWVSESLAEMYEDGTWEKAYDKTLGTVLGDAPKPPAIGSCSTPGAK